VRPEPEQVHANPSTGPLHCHLHMDVERVSHADVVIDEEHAIRAAIKRGLCVARRLFRRNGAHDRKNLVAIGERPPERRVVAGDGLAIAGCAAPRLAEPKGDGVLRSAGPSRCLSSLHAQLESVHVKYRRSVLPSLKGVARHTFRD